MNQTEGAAGAAHTTDESETPTEFQGSTETLAGFPGGSDVENKLIRGEQTIDPTQSSNESDRHDLAAERSEETAAAAIDQQQATETVTGFASFRLWFNRRIRQLARSPVLLYQNQLWTITELTANCELRVEHDDGHFNLIPFDERVVPLVLKQLL